MIRNHPSQGGWLEVVCGPMFSGKSEELIRRLRRAEIAGLRVVMVKPQIDDRFDTQHVVSHSGARMKALGVDSSATVRQLAAGAQVLGVDEVQFLDLGVVGVCIDLADSGMRVIAAGLDSDFRGEPFGPMPELLARADIVDKLQAVCHRCGGAATRTQRLVDGKPAPVDGKTVQVGARDAYEARCRGCHEVGNVIAAPLFP